MKFGAQLQQEIFPPWRLSYIQYDMLKTELKMRQMDHPWSDEDERDFSHLVESELHKVYDFVTAKMREADARICYCERTVKSFMSNPRWASDQSWQIMDDALTEVLFDINDLAKFTRINYTGFVKIVKKHDKWTNLNLKQKLVEWLRVEPLDNQRFDVAIVFISALHDICRRQGKPRTGNAAAGGSQNAFERATAKYWIHPDNVTEVQSILLLHLPVLIFNKDKPYEQTDSAISSVYFDNEDFDLYTGRLQRDEGAEAIRFRWYGPSDQHSIFIERKTHHAPWLNGVSIKDRFRLDAKEVPDFLEGKLSPQTIASRFQDNPQQAKDTEFIATGVQQSVHEKHLRPVVRIFYNRTAFQLPGDQRVRVSLDTDLTFIREKAPSWQEWHRPDVGVDYPFNHVDEKDIVRFPYAVLETKVQSHLGQEPPAWLENLIKSHLVHEVPRFSKYLHAAANLFRDHLPLLPWWLSEMDIDIRKPRETNFGLSRSTSYKPLIDGQYRTAMQAEERRIDVVNAHVNKQKEEEQAAEQQQLEDKDGKLAVPQQRTSNGTLVDEGPTTQQPPPQPQPPTIATDPTKAKEGEAGLLAPGSAMGKHSNISLGTLSSTGSTTYNEPVGATIIKTGDAPRDYGTPLPSPVIDDKNELGEDVQLEKGDIVLDMENKRVITKEKEKKKKDKEAEEEMIAQRPMQLWERVLFGKGANQNLTVKNGDERVPLKKIKIEPKVFFANERTFISWLQFCALLLTVALSLLNFGDNVSRIAGGIFIGISAVVAIYALYRFEKRAWMINRRVLGRYDDLWGPAVLCCLLVGALIVNFYLRFRPNAA
ncbi:hypothetical protein O0I10_010503 [Lichtheimia ornata]|uniref:SPX domain-containing protein n=1 Tax=Lichtheimia ornata TaxID=688661 RepID=A0AAD7UW73_9FUNG|nr:uncharacterized protein O0I10_010503 [Lichtheimia ornata]KAJ8653822.1 hypothetical protein O0I10_010503 [Lichtheimia ornata]